MAYEDYLVKPFDVLFFRDNKAFNFGEWFTEGIFPPLASTFQGLIRTTILVQNNKIGPDGKLIDVKEAEDLVGNDINFPLDILGPFIHNGKKLFIPTPKDTVVIQDGDSKEIKEYRQLRLSKKKNLISSDLELFLHYSIDNPKTKHLFWSTPNIPIELFNKYRQSGILNQSEVEECEQPYSAEDHIGIELEYKSGKERFKKTKEGQFYMTKYHRFKNGGGLYFAIKNKNSTIEKFELNGKYGKLGSEGRGVSIESVKTGINLKQDDSFYTGIAQKRKFKIILLTPGIFPNGWLPIEPDDKISFHLIYAITDSPMKISGYSQLKQKDAKIGNDVGFGKEKTRGYGVKPQVKAVPAGAVYYFEVDNSLSEETIAAWLKSIDGSKIDNDQYSRMGYNHIAVGKII
ncbi:MAG: type III-B CRISPR module-associated protein Cmr3 [Candidatus Hatepunaea meridiana]|nr:type III-B CRISPR module-associated protein Cmr3 [Candidatus Hatepunaea meridiana]